MPREYQDAHRKLRCSQDAGCPAGYQDAWRVPGYSQGAGMLTGGGMPAGTRMLTGCRDTHRVPGCPQGAGVPAGCRDARRVPAPRRGSGATSWAVVSRRPARGERAVPVCWPTGATASFGSPSVCSHALSAGLGGGGAPGWEAGELSASLCSVAPPYPILQIFSSFAAFPEACVFLYHPYQLLVPSEKVLQSRACCLVSGECPQTFPGGRAGSSSLSIKQTAWQESLCPDHIKEHKY